MGLWPTRLLIVAAALLAPNAAAGQSAITAATLLRDLCPARPGKGTPTCTVDAGHVLVELGAFQFSRDKSEDQVSNGYTLGDVLIRVGLTARSEIQVGITSYAIVRTRDRVTGLRAAVHGSGDLSAAFKLNLLSPDGSGTSAALQAFVSAPTGKDMIGSGGWEGGLIVPLAFSLSDKWSIGLDPEVDWRADADGRGHHSALAGVFDLTRDFGSGVSGSVELWSSVDRDPVGHTTQASFDTELAWNPGRHPNLQLDVEVDVGLTDATPAIETSLGLVQRF